jgi:hypothetical protein
MTKEVFERRMRYACETEGRLSSMKARVRGAKHFVRRNSPQHAIEELRHVVNEAQRLQLHLEAWDEYMKG